MVKIIEKIKNFLGIIDLERERESKKKNLIQKLSIMKKNLDYMVEIILGHILIISI